jgi:hypothetical protein
LPIHADLDREQARRWQEAEDPQIVRGARRPLWFRQRMILLQEDEIFWRDDRGEQTSPSPDFDPLPAISSEIKGVGKVIPELDTVGTAHAMAPP